MIVYDTEYLSSFSQITILETSSKGPSLPFDYESFDCTVLILAKGYWFSSCSAWFFSLGIVKMTRHNRGVARIFSEGRTIFQIQ